MMCFLFNYQHAKHAEEMETLTKNLMLPSYSFFSYKSVKYINDMERGTKFMCKNEFFQNLRTKNKTHV